MQLINQVDNIFATLDWTDPKCTKRGIFHSVLNLLFHDSISAEEIKAIKRIWQY